MRPVGAVNHGIRAGRGLCLPVGRNRHPLAVNKDRLDRIADDFDNGNTAAHRDRAGWRVESDVLLFADLAANVAEYPGRQGRREVTSLFLRIEDELVDDDFRILRYRQRRLIGEMKLRLASPGCADLLVANDVVADKQFAARLARHFAGCIWIDLGSDADLFRVRDGWPAETRHPEGCDHHTMRCTRHTMT